MPRSALVHALALCLTLGACGPDRRVRADDLVRRIEAFQAEHGRLPAGLAELGEREHESGPLYYTRDPDGQRYIVWYGTTLGESMVWDSARRAWSAK